MELPLTHDLWARALALTESATDPPLPKQLLLDARYFVACSDRRRFVLDAAAACEVAKEMAVERVWQTKNKGPYRRSKVLSRYDLPKHVDESLRVICGRSLLDEQPNVFADIERLWDARGNVAHGEGAYYRTTGVRVEIDDPKALEILASAEACVRWLDSL
jgi:hypothetical protein